MSERMDSIPQPEVLPPSSSELLTDAFYRWERRGRGWRVWDVPVELEPPFTPFFFHAAFPRQIVDDARKPTFLSSFLDRMRTRLAGASTAPEYAVSFPDTDMIEPEPEVSSAGLSLVELQISLPATLKITGEATEQFLLSLSSCSFPVSFELIGLADSVTVQITCLEPDASLVSRQIEAYFPGVVIARGMDFLYEHWNLVHESFIVELGLSDECMRPLRVFKNFDVDPLIGISAVLGNLAPHEVGLVQVLFRRAHHPWAESMLRAVTDGEGHSFFVDAPEMLPLAKEKAEHPLFAAVIRVAAQSPDQYRARDIVKALCGGFAQFARPDSNELIPLANDDYPDNLHQEDLLTRSSRRSGMILNSRELISLVHLPSGSVRAEKLRRDLKKTKAAPVIAVGHSVVLGENLHQGKSLPVTLGSDQRLRHMHVIGATGTGKSTLLRNLIVQNIEHGDGVGVIDPHGDLIDDILGHIPEKRFHDVVLFDPSDADYPIGFNVLSAHSELEKNILASDLVAVFRRLSTSWGDQMNSVLANAILAFLESHEGGTLVDLRRFLVEADYRRTFLRTVSDREVAYYWEKEFPLLSGRPQGPVLTRLDTFLRPKLIRNMVGQQSNTVNIHEIVNGGKIFLVKLAQGLIGEENAHLLGAFLVSKLHQGALGRQDRAEAERRNFYLTVDEFQNFITPSLASLLSGARKYHLGLILAHQELRQLWTKDTEVAGAVLSNPYTRICFRLGDFDAQKLAEGFSFFDAKDLQNLGVGEAICRIERTDYDFNLTTLPCPAVEPRLAHKRRERLIQLSRERYATHRETVEAELAQRLPASQAPLSREQPREEKRVPVPAAPPEEPKRQVQGTAEPQTVESAPLGRGGQQHKYLQHLVKRMAEEKGYQAIIEHQILDGLGSVDVALHGGERKVACEISVTSTGEQELGNIQKCLAAGYDQVILLSPEKNALAKMKDSVSANLDTESLAKVLFLLPDELLPYFDQAEAKATGTEQTVRGYRVKVQYQPVAEAEKHTRRQAIAQVIGKALRRLKS